jgi:hypothetical protein
MTALQKLDQFLSRNSSPDDWYDLEMDHAQSLAGAFQDSDWSELAAQWPRHEAEWIYRCICSLRGDTVDQARARPILFEMLLHPSQKTAMAAVYSLRRTDWKQVAFPADPRIQRRLDALAEESGEHEREVIAKFRRDASQADRLP